MELNQRTKHEKMYFISLFVFSANTFFRNFFLISDISNIRNELVFRAAKNTKDIPRLQP